MPEYVFENNYYRVIQYANINIIYNNLDNVIDMVSLEIITSSQGKINSYATCTKKNKIVNCLIIVISDAA